MKGITYLQSLNRLFYPKNCASCNNSLLDGERFICAHCQFSLPVTNFHTNELNPLINLFKLRMRVDFISAYLFYDQGLRTQNLLHAIKYKGNKQLAAHLGELYGIELKNSFSPNFDYIIPVPLHKRKLTQRGYNQSEYWANGLSNSCDTPINHSLKRKQNTSSQTKKSRTERVSNVENAFYISSPELLKGKNILLVDDVITTGATLGACGQALWEAGISLLGIVSIAFANKV